MIVPKMSPDYKIPDQKVASYPFNKTLETSYTCMLYYINLYRLSPTFAQRSHIIDLL
jgi:hypothetical protein